MWVLVGCGANEVAIPCMFWSKKDDALAKCREIFKGLEEKVIGNKYRWQCRAYEFEFEDNITSQLFTSYYGGCGECYRAELQEIKEGEKFIDWDLD